MVNRKFTTAKAEIDGVLYDIKKTLFEKKNTLFYFIIAYKQNSREIDGIGFSEAPLNKVIYFQFKLDLTEKDKEDIIDSIITSNFDEDVIKQKLLRKYTSTKIRVTENEERKVDIATKLTRISEVFDKLALIVSNLFFFSFIWKILKFKKIEISASINEKKQEELLFKKTFGDESKFEKYSELINLTKLLISNKTNKNCLIVFGKPGTGKTFVIKRTLLQNKVPHIVMKGGIKNITTFYSVLFENRNSLIVLDDIDIFLDDVNGVNIIKAATDTYSVRVVSYPRTEEEFVAGRFSFGLPSKFEFKGKLIIITNRNLKEIDKTLVSRSYVCEINFNVKEMLTVIEKMLDYMNIGVPIEIKREVIDYLADLVSKKIAKKIDFRIVSTIIDVRYSYPTDWKEYAMKLVS